MSTIKIYTPSGEKIYFHDVVESKIDNENGMIRITQKYRDFNSEVWVMRENIICLQLFFTENDAVYFEPSPPEEKKPKDDSRQQTYSIISMVVSVVCLIAVIIMAII